MFYHLPPPHLFLTCVNSTYEYYDLVFKKLTISNFNSFQKYLAFIIIPNLSLKKVFSLKCSFYFGVPKFIAKVEVIQYCLFLLSLNYE